MNRFPCLASILLVLAPVTAMAQKKTASKPSARGTASAAKAASGDILPFNSEKPGELLDEDKVIGALKLHIKPENVKITPVEEVFAR